MRIRSAPPAPFAAGDDPTRLLRAEAGMAGLMKAYAKRTRPGDRGTIAAWYRLRPALDVATPEVGVAASVAPVAPLWRWTRARVLSGALTISLVLLVVVKMVPARGGRYQPDGRGGVGLGGASGWIEPGSGGAEGSSGTHGGAEAAALDARAGWLPRAG